MKITLKFLRSFVALCLLCTVICACGTTDANADKNPTDTTPQTEAETLDPDVFYVKTDGFIAMFESLDSGIADSEWIVVCTVEEVGKPYFSKEVDLTQVVTDRQKYELTKTIETPFTLRVSEVLKSTTDLSAGDTLTVTEFFGQVDQYCQLPFDGEIVPEKGYEYIMFLSEYNNGIIGIHAQESVRIEEDGKLRSLLRNDKLYADCNGKEDAIAKIKALLDKQP